MPGGTEDEAGTVHVANIHHGYIGCGQKRKVPIQREGRNGDKDTNKSNIPSRTEFCFTEDSTANILLGLRSIPSAS